MTAPLTALAMADRSVPGPLSALLVTTCAEAVAPPAKTSMSRAGIKTADNDSIRLRAEATPRQAVKKLAGRLTPKLGKGWMTLIL